MGATAADVPRLARDAGAIYAKWGHLIHRYHGGCPEALIAVRMQVESAGRMDAPGDRRQGEVGLLQITASTEKRFGVPDQFRYTAEGNVFLGGLRYNVDTALVFKRYPGLISPNAPAIDAYLFGGMLVSAIGTGSVDYLYDRAPRNLTFYEFARWARDHRGSLPASGPWGGQSLDKVLYRIDAVYYMGEAAKLATGVPNDASAPVIPPWPSNLKSLTIPGEVRTALKQQTGGEGFWAPRPGDVAAWKQPPAWGRGGALALAGVIGVGVVVGIVAAVRS